MTSSNCFDDTPIAGNYFRVTQWLPSCPEKFLSLVAFVFSKPDEKIRTKAEIKLSRPLVINNSIQCSTLPTVFDPNERENIFSTEMVSTIRYFPLDEACTRKDDDSNNNRNWILSLSHFGTWTTSLLAPLSLYSLVYHWLQEINAVEISSKSLSSHSGPQIGYFRWYVIEWAKCRDENTPRCIYTCTEYGPSTH